MKNVLKNYLENASFTLSDAQSRIDYNVNRGRITPEAAEELLVIAEQRAVADINTENAKIEQLISGLSTATTIAEIRSIAKEILTAAEEA